MKEISIETFRAKFRGLTGSNKLTFRSLCIFCDLLSLGYLPDFLKSGVTSTIYFNRLYKLNLLSDSLFNFETVLVPSNWLDSQVTER